MGKYEPLSHYLDAVAGDVWDASFHDIEGILGFALPPSALAYNAWWANETSGSHVQKRSWLGSGWETRNVDLRAKRVRFERSRRGGAVSGASSLHGREDLWLRARQLSGIADRDRLIEAALAALVQREAAQSLARLGGSSPDAAAGPRNRRSS